MNRRWILQHVPSPRILVLSLLGMLTVQAVISTVMRYSQGVPALLVAALSTGRSEQVGSAASCGSHAPVDLNWHPPIESNINNLEKVVNGSGTYGFIFNSSHGPLDTYNWCNMPHVHPSTYTKVNDTYKLEYVEVIHRHHKRTPYASNTFPVENYPWYCDDSALFYGGKPINPYGNTTTDTYWKEYMSPSNPFHPTGFLGTCQFPQIPRGGLDDSHQHGADLKAVYSDMLGFLPKQYNANLVSFRVTNNVITSQVASMLIAGMFPDRANSHTPLLIQPATIDSLEPAYSCPAASNLFGSYGPGSNAQEWLEHLRDSADLFARLDALSGVDPNAQDWHKSWDHYFDNLSARLCHAKALPCKAHDGNDCVSMQDAEKVFRLGEYEYSFMYRDNSQSLPASVASYGVWIAELAQNLRGAMGETSSSYVRYRHSVAHDGSISRLLSILQVERMVWPGMGAEVVFELYSRDGCDFLRVLWGGKTLLSSNPSLGSLDLVPVALVLDYFDGLVGQKARKIPDLCRPS
jgi:2-phosphoxylose phosphatase